ncbi:hypothetical protein SDC9_199646 [bioreactor metagenome]|uniref:Uncharacterized protein n=1 Tax=bioreactor metagenome TaxID=1076179 RepID=A0A645IUB9_9ZZZZ
MAGMLKNMINGASLVLKEYMKVVFDMKKDGISLMTGTDSNFIPGFTATCSFYG